METLGLKNINMLTKEQYDRVAEPVQDELWTVEVETYSDGDGNWYRVYPDGWCEQGGMISYNAANRTDITFLKPFINKNYSAYISGYWSGSTAAACVVDYNLSTTTTLVTFRDGTAMGASWYACGYIAI